MHGDSPRVCGFIQSRSNSLPQAVQFGIGILVLDQVQHRQSRGNCDRVTAQCSGLVYLTQWRQRFHGIGTSANRPNRKSPANHFAHTG